MRREELDGESLFLIHDFFSPEECRRSIAFSEERGYEEAPISTDTGFVMVKEIRNNLRVMVDAVSLAKRLFARAGPFLPTRVGPWHLHGMNERFRYYRYDVGQTFKMHYDGCFTRRALEESRVTFMVYLNDDYAGGTTDFYHDDETPRTSIRPRRGLALAFLHHQLHEGAPVTRGRKYVLRTDVMYRLRPTAPGEAGAGRGDEP
jgi:predicted 2-oxoglutarate/Fe(II)-dependent dioxygenase YbiX